MLELIKTIKIINIILLLSSLYSPVAISILYNQKLDPKYGNGQSSQFIDAMYGSSTDISDAELQEIERSIPPKITDRYFLRLGVTRSSSNISSVTNISEQPLMMAAKVASISQKTSSKYGMELAFGYRLDKLSMEMEALAIENVKFNKKPLFSNQPGTLNSTVKAQAILANVYYDFINLKFIHAFVGAGVGASINRTNANFSDAPPISKGVNFPKRTIAGTLNLVLGFKLNIVPQLFINGSCRYTSFTGVSQFKNKFKKKKTQTATGNQEIKKSSSGLDWRDEGLNLKLTGQRSIMGFSVSLTHVFI